MDTTSQLSSRDEKKKTTFSAKAPWTTLLRFAWRGKYIRNSSFFSISTSESTKYSLINWPLHPCSAKLGKKKKKKSACCFYSFASKDSDLYFCSTLLVNLFCFSVFSLVMEIQIVKSLNTQSHSVTSCFFEWVLRPVFLNHYHIGVP